MTQPLNDPFPEGLPQEIVALAEEFGISAEEIETVHKIITLTPELPARAIAINGQTVGDGVVRVAREYDSKLEDGYTLLTVTGENMQLAVLVPREDLVNELFVALPDVPSAPGPKVS